MLLTLLLACFMVLSTAYFSLLESAIIAVNDLKLAILLGSNPSNKTKIQTIFRRKQDYLSALVLLNTIISIAGSSMMGAFAARFFNDTGLMIFTGVLTYCMLVFAKILPKAIAPMTTSTIFAKHASVILIIGMLCKPILAITLVWMRLLPLKLADSTSANELKAVMKYYKKHGVISKEQRKLAERSLEIDNRKLSVFSRKKSVQLSISATSTVANLKQFLQISPVKRYGVKDQGKLIGVVLYKDIVDQAVKGNENVIVTSLMLKSISLSSKTSLLNAVRGVQQAQANVILISDERPSSDFFITEKQVYKAFFKTS